MMQKFLTAIFTLASLTACVSHYGNYAAIPEEYNAQLAADSANELVTLYPPASTQLVLVQSAEDPYGTELIGRLREQGYAVKEASQFSFRASPPPYCPSTNGAHSLSPRDKYKPVTLTLPPAEEKETVPVSNSDTSFGYVVDQVDEFYRVKLTVGSRILSRMYEISGTGVHPAGYWTQME